MIGKKLQKALGLAVEELKRRRHEYLTLEHVLYGIASEPSGRKLIERCGGSAPVLRQALDHFFKTYMESLDEPTKDVYQTLAVQRARWRTSKARDGTRTSVLRSATCSPPSLRKRNTRGLPTA